MQTSASELEALYNHIHTLSEADQRVIFKQLDELTKLKDLENCREHFLPFVQRMWPVFIPGRHHAKMADAFERVARGECKRLIINMPPRHTKSEFASWLLPSWFLGKFPHKKVIQTSHTAELATGFGRKVRNLVDTDAFSDVFPGVSLQTDSKAAGRWNTNKGGDYFAIGVNGAVTGKGADILIIDDPHSEQEAALAEGDPSIYDKVYEWYTSGPRQRLQPGAAIIIVMCMVGDTPVRMANGTNTLLKDIRPGDMVATFDNGRLGVSRVNNWRSSGVDSVYTVQTQSGIVLRANERHPFLVLNEGILEWTRLNQLRVGDELVSLKDVVGHLEQKQNSASAARACQKRTITEKTLTLLDIQLGTTVSGKGKNVTAVNQLTQKDCVILATQNNIHQQNRPQSKTELGASNTGTGLLLKILHGWLMSAVTGVMYAGNNRPQKIQGRIGTKSYVSTTTIAPGQFVDYSATNAISQSDMAKRQMFSNELRRISDFTTDPIVSITPDGEQEVFDVEVDRTENFIANGVVSHNTRWSLRDLTGQVLKADAQRNGEGWEVIEFPAILPSGNPLWPQFWSLEEMTALRNELPPHKWNAQYQQAPTSREGAIIKHEWWRIWEEDDPPQCNYIIQSWDTAFEKTNRSDYSACTTWGIWNNERANDGKGQSCIILLDAFKDRMEFPDLKRVAHEHYKQWEPDSFIVERKASGASLIQELRRSGIPVQEYTPSRGQDKIARLNSVADIFASGRVYAPQTRWSEELVDEVASFPAGEHDDYVDATTLALMRFRQGGFITTDLDEPDPVRYFKSRRAAGYY